MKISNFFFAAVYGKKVTIDDFNEFFGKSNSADARFLFSETDALFQQLQFYLSSMNHS